MRRKTLAFSALDLPALDRCENFLPCALPALQGRCGQTYLPVIAAADKSITKIDARDVTNPDVLQKLTTEASGSFAFGPACGESRPITIPDWRPHDLTQATGSAVIGLIDTGMAFWNRRFVIEGRPQFSGMAFLDLNGTAETLSQTEIGALCADADRPGGDEWIRNYLGQRFPQSIYGLRCGRAGLLQPGEMSHGTAIADIAGRFDPGRPGTAPALFGLELPQEVLLDSSGGSLEVMIETAIRMLVAMIETSPGVTDATSIVICLPFGFPGGPHDGSRDSARALRGMMTDSAFAHVHLVLPTGNHLQHRCHARLPKDLGSGTESPPLGWFLEPMDRSANTLDIYYRGAPPVLKLTAPDGRSATHPFADAQFARLLDGDAVIGGAWKRKVETPEGWSRLRVTLGATAALEPSLAVTPSGCWTVELHAPDAEIRDVNFWLLRDDWPGRGAAAQQYLQSCLVDPTYASTGPYGVELVDDSAGDSLIRRAGTASVLTTAIADRIVSVGARERIFADGETRPAGYSGLPYDGVEREYEVVDDPAPRAGTPAIGNGSPELFRVSGTSVAAALRASRIAAQINGA